MKLFVFARAKVNLCLDVFDLRPDGYHEVASVMQSLALHDVLALEAVPEGISLQVTGEAVTAGEENLVLRAARHLAAATGCRRGAAVTLHKNVPVAAGLGGGSADAAAVLVGLNSLWRLECEPGFLAKIGAVLGADVPFCLAGGTALATGRGEKLTRLPPLPELGVLLLKPPYGLSTAAVYRAFDSARPNHRPVAWRMAEALAGGDWREALQWCSNALEAVAFREHPELAVLKQELQEAGALCALMSGSGPTVFGIFATVAEAARAGEFFKRRPLHVIVTNTAAAGVFLGGEKDDGLG
ncbi:MAG: 4-(cytidine 5'-diphospho)-2-C-methyl-D-erythritol kinase [Bacillota bacterium]|nr:4-(cytidine 5'-diphospho)-2-C-methyl-D-erythritol kinase [Thermoanaerobacteraceae bacterium]